MEKAAQIQMLTDFSNANAVPGFEHEFVKMFVDRKKPFAYI